MGERGKAGRERQGRAVDRVLATDPVLPCFAVCPGLPHLPESPKPAVVLFTYRGPREPHLLGRCTTVESDLAHRVAFPQTHTSWAAAEPEAQQKGSQK